MTQNLFNDLSRAFITDCPPIHAVAVSHDEKVFVVAEMHKSYYPRMPKGNRNRGYISTDICELVDKGVYCTLKTIKSYRYPTDAQITFSGMARENGWAYANNRKELNRILKKIFVDNNVA